MNSLARMLMVGLVVTVGLTVAVAAQRGADSAPALLRQAIDREVVDGDTAGAIRLYQEIADRFATTDRATAPEALLHAAEAARRLGRTAEARVTYQRILDRFVDQPAAVASRAHLRATPGGAVGVQKVRVATDLGVYAVPSPDGRYLASSAPRHIVLRDIATGETRAVTSECCVGPSLAFSPDGRQIAYNQSGRGEYTIRVVRPDGTNVRVLVSESEYRNRIVRGWSPDGRTLVMFSNRGGDGGGQIELLRVADGTTVRLKSTGWRYPDIGGFSPDGRYVVYSYERAETEPGGIFALAVDGSGEHAIVESAPSSADFTPTYAPDGGQVVFLSDRSGAVDLWTVPVRDGRPRGAPVLLETSVGNVAYLRFAGGGLFYGIYNVQADSFTVALDAGAQRVSGTARRVSDRLVGSNGMAKWSPNGTLVAFMRRGPREARRLVVRDVPSGDERTLLTAEFPNVDDPPFHWFPDGGRLLVAIPRNDRRLFFEVHVASGARTELFRLPNAVPIAPWVLSRDGTAVYYSSRSDDGATLRLIRRDLTAGDDTVLFEAASRSAALFGLALSPDGKRLALQYAAAAPPVSIVAVLPADGGPARELVRGNPGEFAQGAIASAWSADNKHVLFIKTSAGAAAVWRVPADGGDAEPLGGDLGVVHGVRSLEVGPGDRSLTLAARRATPEVWRVQGLVAKYE